MSLSEETRKKISEKLKGRVKDSSWRTCECCGTEFVNDLKKGRKIRCKSCRRQVSRVQETTDLMLMDLPKRTITKILQRANLSCAICGWDEARCDIHHIVEQAKGGSDDPSNLICVCPNHHRVIHNNKTYNVDELQELSLEKTFSNWKDFYDPR